MKISASALWRACVLASVPIATFAQAPVVVEAENASVLGSSLSVGTLGDVTYITGVNGTTPPTTPERVASWNVTFPAAGNYDLYVRIWAGPNGGNDDSFYISSVGFNNQNWGALYNTSSGGYANPALPVFVEGTPGAGTPSGTSVWKWVRLTNHPGRGGGTGPNAWVVPAGSLTQTFYWASREDGLFFDKFAFGPAGTCYSGAELNAGLPGTVTCPPPPPPPPPPFTYAGPPIATGKAKFLGSAWSPGNASANFVNYFNKVTPENAGKWGSAEPTRDSFNWNDLDTAYNLAKSNGYPFHFHVLFWGNQQPNWIDELTTEEQLVEIHEWLAAIAARYPAIDILEVVNEPLHDPPCTRENGGGGYCDALGGRGTPEERAKDPDREWLWIVNSFKLARQYFPNAKLMLNDYSIENETPQTTRYINIIKLLQAQNLIDVIGLQGHAFSQSEAAPMPTYRANLDRIASKTGLPIQITELDVDGTEDAVQLAGMQKIFPIYWEHPQVEGVTLWGYKQFNHWRNAQGAWLVWSQAGSEGAERPAMTWIRGYVNNTRPTLGNRWFNVSSGAVNGDTVGTLTATDPDPGTVFSAWAAETTGPYAGLNGNSVFAVSAAGVVTVADAAALSAAPSGTEFKLFVTVWDGYQRMIPHSITITVN
jgi:GH35 family endo-1,4-beta-xylanase